MISEETRAKWRKAVDFITEYGDPYINSWEEGFVQDMSIRLANGHDLLFKQSSVLHRIWTHVQEKVG